WRLDARVAVRFASAAPGLARNATLRQMVPSMMGWRGRAYLLAGRLTDSVAGLEWALSQSAEMRFGAQYHNNLALRAEARPRMGEVVEAERLAGRALELCRAHRQRGWEADTLRILAEIAADPARTDLDRAATCYREAMTLP